MGDNTHRFWDERLHGRYAELQDLERVIEAITQEALKAIKKDGVEAFVLGCTGMVSVAEHVKDRLKKQTGYDVPVLEAAQCALTLLELYARMGLKQSRITYMTPPHPPAPPNQ